MAYYTDPLEETLTSQQGGLDTTPTPFSEALGTATLDSFARLPTWRALGALSHALRNATDAPIPVEELNTKYGIKNVLSFDHPVSERTAEDLYLDKHAQAIRQQTLSTGPTSLLARASEFAAGALPQFLDPINVASTFVPGLGDARLASALGRAGEALTPRLPQLAEGLNSAAQATTALGETLGATQVGRITQGASQGVSGQAALEPVDYLIDKDDHEDWTMGQALRDLAFGALAGGALGGLGVKAEEISEGSPARILQHLDADRRGALLNEALAAASEGRETIAPHLSQVLQDTPSETDLIAASDSAQAAVLTPPRPESAARRESELQPIDSPHFLGEGTVGEAQARLDHINEQLGIGTDSLKLPESARSEIDTIHAERTEEDRYAAALEAATSCLARNR